MTAQVRSIDRAPMTDCTCERCVNACRYYPGWMTVEEARAAMAAGLGNRLMKDCECGKGELIDALCPAIAGYEGEEAPEGAGDCTFLKDNRCSIHFSGFKPRVCREVFACRGEGSEVGSPSTSSFGHLSRSLLADWGTGEGRALVAEWERQHDHRSR